MTRTIVVFFCALLLFSSCSSKEKVSVEKVEHFYLSANNAVRTFQILSEGFDLPIVWDYQNWGGFSSGGLTLGNVVIELIEGQPSQTQTYYGVALEPSHSLNRAVPFLDAANISHGSISRATKWSTMSLTNMLPEDINLFLCDYHDREFVRLDRKKAVDELIENNGGALGIQFLQEITIGTEAPADFESELAKIPGVVKKGNEFHFSEGPSLRLIKSDHPVFSLLVKVKSVHKAKEALEAMGLKTKNAAKGIAIIDDALSISITLSDL